MLLLFFDGCRDTFIIFIAVYLGDDAQVGLGYYGNNLVYPNYGRP